MAKVSKKWLADVAERTGWTAAQAGLGVAITAVTDLSTQWAVPIAAALAVLKAAVARHVGDPDTAATLPAEQNPAGVGG